MVVSSPFRLLISAAASSVLVLASLLHLAQWMALPSILLVAAGAGIAVMLLLVHHFSAEMDPALWGRRFERWALWGVVASWAPLALRQFGLHYLPFRWRWLVLPEEAWAPSIQWSLFWAKHGMAQHFLGAGLLAGLVLLLMPKTRRWGAAISVLTALPGGLTAWFFGAGPVWLWAIPLVPVFLWSLEGRQPSAKPAWPFWAWPLLLGWTFFAAWPAFQEEPTRTPGLFTVVDFYGPGQVRPKQVIWDQDNTLLFVYANGSSRMADVRTGASNPEAFVAQWKIPAAEQGQRMQGTWTLDTVDDAYTLEGTWNGQEFRLRAVAP
jgi:hypothetical protein